MSKELHYTEDEYVYCQELCPYSHMPFEDVSGIEGTRIGSAACSECKYNEYVQRTVKYVMCTANEVFDKVKPTKEPVKGPVVVINKDDNRVFKRNMIKSII